MSVILTAGKNSWSKLHDAEKKVKKKSRVSSVTPTAIQETPPYSNGRTSVWYWTLDGVQTTLMFSKLTMEIWCNGRTLSTTLLAVLDDGKMGFVALLQTKTRRYGAQIIEFCLQSTYDENATIHRGCISIEPSTFFSGGRRASETSTSMTALGHKLALYVDDQYVDEHVRQ